MANVSSLPGCVDVRKMRPLEITGVLAPSPGNGVFHNSVWSFKASGSEVSSLTPQTNGPRHCGHSDAEHTAAADKISILQKNRYIDTPCCFFTEL
jgi:hypothetical protein